MWAGSVTIELEIRPKDEEALKVLDKMESVAEWSYKENAEGNLAVEVKVNGTEDIREELSLAFAEEKCAILTMKKSQASLEQVFLELTEDNASEEDVTEGGEDDASDL